MIYKNANSSHIKKILWIEDDRYSIQEYINEFELNNYNVKQVMTAKEAIDELEKNGSEYRLAIIDIRMNDAGAFDSMETHGGFETGIKMASHIVSKYPEINIMAFSAYGDQKIKKWFKDHDIRYVIKTTDITPKRFFEIAASVLKENEYIPKIFIVHGHDTKLKEDLATYIENNLKLGKPTILGDEPNKTFTIIEKFENQSQGIDLVFVLLTPDDKVITDKGETKYQARQNVIFELGYFIGKIGREKGNIIVCYKDGVEIPSDLAGVAYINLTNGVIKADEKIKREIRENLDFEVFE